VSSRWLDRADAEPITGSTSKPDDSGASVNSPTPSVAAAPLAADARSASPSGSVSTLFLVIVGALAVAALFGGLIFRFGNARRNDRQDFDRAQRAPWDAVDVGTTIRSPPLATETPAPPRPARERHEAVIPDEIVQLLSRLSKEAAA
jgi:hypothetical protein